MSRCASILAIASVAALIAGCVEVLPGGGNPTGPGANAGGPGHGALADAQAATSGVLELPPDPPPPPWSQYQVGPGGSGAVSIRTYAATQYLEKWSVLLPAAPLYASPAVAADGTIVVASQNGQVTSLTPAGQIRWQQSLYPGSQVVSSPAIDEQGNVFVVETHHIAAQMYFDIVSTLNKLGPDGAWLGSQSLNEGVRVTNASPKIWQGNVILSTPIDVELFDSDLIHLSYGGLLHCIPICAWDSLFVSWDRTFRDCLTSFPPACAYGRGNGTIHDSVPTAVIDAAPYVTNPLHGAPMIIATSGYCLGGFMLQDGQLQPMWYQNLYDLNPDECHVDRHPLGSPAILHDNLVVVADPLGQVRAYSVFGGPARWIYTADDDGFTTPPVCAGNNVYLAGQHTLRMLNDQGQFIRKITLAGSTFAAPAASNKFVYVSTTAGVQSLSLDLLSQSYLNSNVLGGASTPIIAPNGMILAAGTDGRLHAFGAPPFDRPDLDGELEAEATP